MPDHSKAKTMKTIGEYLREKNDVGKTIVLFACDKSGTDEATPKRDRLVEEGDILHILKYFRIVNGAFDGNGGIVLLAALTALSSFARINPHYAYMSVNDEKDDTGDEESILCDESEMPTVEEMETKPCFVMFL